MLLLSILAAASLSTGPQFVVGDSVNYKNLLIFPIRKVAKESVSYLTLDEGMKSGLVVITERGQDAPGGIIRRPPGGPNVQQQRQQEVRNQQQTVGGGAAVNELVLINKSDKKLLLLAGEIVIGGNQDRVIGKDMIVLPHSDPISLSVFCVEHGRWNKQSDNFGALGGVAHPELRKNAQHENNQQKVWDEVAKNTGSLNAKSSTGRYQEVYKAQNVDKELKPYLDAYAKFPLKDACGAVIAYNGRFVWLDAFATPEIFAKYWPKLLRSYVIGAAAERDRPHIMIHLSREMAQAFLDDRSGKSSFEGEESVYLLTKITQKSLARYELQDKTGRVPVLSHISRMRTE